MQRINMGEEDKSRWERKTKKTGEVRVGWWFGRREPKACAVYSIHTNPSIIEIKIYIYIEIKSIFE